MTIIRNIDGKDCAIELTNEERWKIFEEVEHENDLIDIKNEIENFSDEDLLEMYGMTYSIMQPLFDAMAYRKRKYVDRWDMDWCSATVSAIRDIVDESKKEKKALSKENK